MNQVQQSADNSQHSMANETLLRQSPSIGRGGGQGPPENDCPAWRDFLLRGGSVSDISQPCRRDAYVHFERLTERCLGLAGRNKQDIVRDKFFVGEGLFRNAFQIHWNFFLFAVLFKTNDLCVAQLGLFGVPS